ncbi:alpha-1B-glycoprotein isoform X3 [Pipistrellus kuhlii]|uniref:alpha-1B-glycoprotein isoform X3 n=1 Tax=Pipistrellus kuhlii TaxID=59472 RepID=UPI001E27392E|nr:alpha-1B-glycoprotein isoform X3 [Pipistrellus kuhlii]
MSTLATVLLLWGLSLGPAAEAATFVDPRPDLWAEAGSLREPWASLTLVCRAQLATSAFQLFKDGVAVGQVHPDEGATEWRFPLGAVSEGLQGLYRCRCALGSGSWTSLSNPVEVTGPGTLPAPKLSSSPVAWVTQGLTTTLLCRAGLLGVTFLLRREGDPQFLEVAEAPRDAQAAFRVLRAGNYTCSYRTHEDGTPSEPSAPVAVEDMAQPPAPRLSVGRGRDAEAAVLAPGEKFSLSCKAPLDGVEFQLRRGGQEERSGYSWGTYPDRINFERTARDAGLYTCRYRLSEEGAAWSPDSAPVELLLSDGPLPKPRLRALWSGKVRPGQDAALRCEKPVAHESLELLAAGEVVASAYGPSEDLVLPYVGPQHAGTYSCRYRSRWPLVSELSDPVELQVAEP